MKHRFEKYCKDYTNIENYENAAADNFVGWCCHHRKGVDITTEKLIALGIYYDRPAEELIFLTRSEHGALHNKGKKGKHFSEETKKKMSEAKKGKHFSEETKKKMSEAKKNMSEETKKKMSEAKKCRHWYNNGKINIRAKECLPGFVPGKLKRK